MLLATNPLMLTPTLLPDPGSASVQLMTSPRFGSFLFSNDFGTSAILSMQPTLSNAMNYGEDVTNTSSRGLSVHRPTTELPLDEILSNVDLTDIHWSSCSIGRNEPILVANPDIMMSDSSGSGPSCSGHAFPLPIR